MKPREDHLKKALEKAARTAGPMTISTAPSLSLAECTRLLGGSDPWATLGFGESHFRIIAKNSRDSTNVKVIIRRKVIAFTSFKFGFMRGAYMSLLTVDPDYRHTGVGNALMDYAEKLIYAQTKNVFLCVASFNTGAQKFFERRGYRSVGVLHRLIVDEYDEILFRKCSDDH
jgi:[ribosomal protein S18]-alanine N-acetyltransferase